MKIKTLLFYCLVLLLPFSFSQGWAQLSSGTYSRGLHLAFDSTHQTITGYVEAYGGYDEEINQPKFSCIFFIHGIVKDRFAYIKTYYPFEQNADTITGYLKIINENTFEMKLDDEHGGCWNVSHFATEPVVFNLEEKINALQVSYSVVPEMKIYSDFTSEKQILYSITNTRFFFIQEKQNGRCRILVDGKQPMRGWVSSKDIMGF